VSVHIPELFLNPLLHIALTSWMIIESLFSVGGKKYGTEMLTCFIAITTGTGNSHMHSLNLCIASTAG
jgi:hypothetical protein